MGIRAAFKAWNTRRKIETLKAEFRMTQRAAAQCAQNGNVGGHGKHYLALRDIYKRLRDIDPSCPPWEMTRQEARREIATLAKREKRKLKDER